MITNIIEYELNDDEKIHFEDIDKIDVNARILQSNAPNGLYELSNKIRLENIYNIEKKYGLELKPGNLWTSKINKIIENFNKEDFIKFINYAKELLLSTFGKEYGLRAYKNFLQSSIIWDGYFYNTFIEKDNELKNFLYNELKEIIKYYPDREYKVGFVIDRLYGYYGSNKLDNFGETDRYNYWRKYKEKGEVKLMN